MQNNDIYMLPCPNCKQPTIQSSHTNGLLTDWCDSCNTSIFDTSSDVEDNELPF
jgi:hypothetical protein